MAITDSAIRAAKAKDKPYKLYDDEGLFMLVSRPGVSFGDSNTDLPARRNFSHSARTLPF
jgi:hypothetical protein